MKHAGRQTIAEEQARSKWAQGNASLDGWTPGIVARAQAAAERTRQARLDRDRQRKKAPGAGTASVNRLRRRRVAAGVCRTCRNPRGPEGTAIYCRACADRHALRARRSRGTSETPAVKRWERLHEGQTRTDVAIVTTVDEVTEWKHFAATQGMSLSAVVREAVRSFIEATDEEESWRDGVAEPNHDRQ